MSDDSNAAGQASPQTTMIGQVRIVHTCASGVLVFGTSYEDSCAIFRTVGGRWRFFDRIGAHGA